MVLWLVYSYLLTPLTADQHRSVMPRAFLIKSLTSRPSHQPYVRPWADVGDEENDENNNSSCVVNAMHHDDENRVPFPVVDDARGRRVSVVKSSSPPCDSTTMPFSEERLGHVTPGGTRRAAGRNRRPLEALPTNVVSATPGRRNGFRYHTG